VRGAEPDEPAVVAPRRARHYGAFPLLALAATTCLETGERASLSQAADGIQRAFHVSDRAIGFLPFAMSIVGVVGSFPFGYLADRVRRTRMLAVAMAVWTACMAAAGLATSYVSLFVSRMGVGMVEANGPAAQSLLSDYYPVRERAKRMGLYSAGGLAGAIVGLGLGGLLVGAESEHWKAAFWMWIPFGVATIAMLLYAPEPRRGEQDAEFHRELAGGDPTLEAVEAADAGGMAGVDATSIAGRLDLPPPPRVGTLDYNAATWGPVVRELFRIRSMWFAVVAITVSQSLLTGLGFWGVPYFKRVFHLSSGEAGIFTIVFGLGAAAGVLSGGMIADRFLRRGIVNARVYVVIVSCIAATVVLLPAFASTHLGVTLPLFLVGGYFLTLPIAPGDALLTDVVVSPLRGRASAVRSVVRTASAASIPLIGYLSDLTSLRVAFLLFTPLYAVGGLVMIGAARTYPSDLAFVLAETARIEELKRAEMTSASPSREDAADG
jgi:MFS family permease